MNGGEKDEMLAVLCEIFIGTGLADKIEQLSVDEDGVIIRIENKNVSKPPVKAEHGQVYNKVFADA